jgi:hypothetical protein
MVFGLSGAIIGLTTIILPETLGQHLPRTILEAEKNRAFVYFKFNFIFRSVIVFHNSYFILKLLLRKTNKKVIAES